MLGYRYNDQSVNDLLRACLENLCKHHHSMKIWSRTFSYLNKDYCYYYYANLGLLNGMLEILKRFLVIEIIDQIKLKNLNSN